MKNKFWSLLIAPGCLALAFSCREMPPSHFESNILQQENGYDCTNQKFIGLTPEEFALGVKKYKITHMKAAESVLRADFSQAKQLSRMCWFPLDTLKKFICLIETAAMNDGVRPEDLGIDFSYAVYPMENPVTIEGRNYNYKNLHTLFMVPTRFVKGEGHLAFGIDSTLSDSKSLESMIKRRESNKKILAIAAGISTINAKNQGQLCPPTCSGAMLSLLQAADDYPTDGPRW